MRKTNKKMLLACMAEKLEFLEWNLMRIRGGQQPVTSCTSFQQLFYTCVATLTPPHQRVRQFASATTRVLLCTCPAAPRTCPAAPRTSGRGAGSAPGPGALVRRQRPPARPHPAFLKAVPHVGHCVLPAREQKMDRHTEHTQPVSMMLLWQKQEAR
jgi:hypothetical protein